MKPADINVTAAVLPRSKTRVFISHADWDHLSRKYFTLAHDLGHARLGFVLDEVQDDIDLLNSLRKDIDLSVAGAGNDDYEEYDALISPQYPSVPPQFFVSGHFGVGKTTAFAAVVGSFQTRANALAGVSDQDILAVAARESLRFTPMSRDELARLDVQKHIQELHQEIARLLSLSRFFHGMLVAVMRRFKVADFFRDTLLRECPWHLVHGTHPPDSFASFEARGFAAP